MQHLTPKQERFCQKYIETGNASKAYRQAVAFDGDKQLFGADGDPLTVSGYISGRLVERNR